MKEKLEEIRNLALKQIDETENLEEIENIKVKYLGRKGELNTIRRGIKDLSPEEKPVIGELANTVAYEIENKLENKGEGLYKQAIAQKLEAEKIDVTLPGIYKPYGKQHPLTSTINEIINIFQGLGFSIVENQNSPEVETEYYNFDSLNFPPEHPAKDMQDTFYTNIAPQVLLRSQTSNSQIREMQKKSPPLRVISPGRVYRSEAVSSRKNNLFHQVEGFLVDKDVTFGDLKGILNEFIRQYFGQSRPTRFRTSFFPFTEPSAEIDVQCIICSGKGCRTCSGTGWLEILGAGMIDPNVLKNVNIDPEIYTGFAFGMGVERLAMLKFAINDIRLFFNNDVRFLEQF
ncbi:MAG: phenylalanine--tRNA ligase subunit alpha [Candidatus Melainabacteria bacterium RIFOXYA12_FULL_32_12]|nr:MAG: phenylalanine--tRNA ligase subunit alpha [Candidatus Melainabacteria bacterium RIFOXYA2_FULL_32_9]OGI29199.1 MAG: phenylalanine--tRNA ligase subunit alpha [Candidatus Melainabacteria bacterium RIFOXYA12_FULL_32_12]